MSTAEERFQAMMAKRKKNKESDISKEVIIKEEKSAVDKGTKKDIKEIFTIEDNIFDSLTQDKELIEYLKNKSFEMLKIQGNNIIMLGKNLTEVFEELGRKGSPEGLYLRYLEFNGYKKDTALRLRKRYELFKKSKSDVLKQIISILPIRSIEQLYKEQEKLLPILEAEEDGLTYKRGIELLNSNIKSLEMDRKIEITSLNYNIEKIDNLYKKINNQYEELDNKKKEKLSKLLFEIEKLLG